MLLTHLYHQSLRQLRDSGVPEAETDTVLLLGHMLGLSRTGLVTARNRVVSVEEQTGIVRLIGRRRRREPLAYILGEKEFWSRSFRVTPEVLIPRPETEILVECCLAALTEAGIERARILDLGTGSGAIGVTLALELPGVRVCAVDRSLPALQLARENALRLGAIDRMEFVNSDWAGGLALGGFDLVVANPPYIRRSLLGEDEGAVAREVRAYEPCLALDGGEQGLDAIRCIHRQLPDILRPGGWFFMEIGADQAEPVTDLFRSPGCFERPVVHSDYAGLPRVFQTRRSLPHG